MVYDVQAMYGVNNFAGMDYNVAQFRELQKKHPDLRSLLVPISVRENHSIADVVKENNDIFAGAYLQVVPRVPEVYAKIDDMNQTTTPEEIAKLALRKEIVGLKLLTSVFDININDQLIEPYADIASRLGLPLLIHCGSDGEDYTAPEDVELFVKAHPKLTVILAHMGGLNPFFYHESISLAKEHTNVYLTTTGLSGEHNRFQNDTIVSLKDKLKAYWANALKFAMEEVPDKILHGSDFPYLKYDLWPIDQLLEEQQKLILEENPKKVFLMIKIKQ